MARPRIDGVAREPDESRRADAEDRASRLERHASSERDEGRSAELMEALGEIYDPEMPCSLVDLGLIYEACVEEGCAKIVLTYTAIGCPAREMIEDDIRARLLRIPGVRRVDIQVVWSPPWTKERLTARGRELLLASGYSI